MHVALFLFQYMNFIKTDYVEMISKSIDVKFPAHALL
jgi:hypothetical protein